MTNLFKICSVGALLACVCCASEAQAGGRRRNCYYGPTYAAPAAVTYAAPATGVATTGSNMRYQSAYQAPAAAPARTYYYAPAPTRTYRSWDEKEFARHIKGL